MDFRWWGRRHAADVRKLSVELAQLVDPTWREQVALVEQACDAWSGALVTAQYRIPAPGSVNRSYLLLYDARADDAPCFCLAGQTHHACWHRGVALIWGRALRTKLSKSGR